VKIESEPHEGLATLAMSMMLVGGLLWLVSAFELWFARQYPFVSVPIGLLALAHVCVGVSSIRGAAIARPTDLFTASRRWLGVSAALATASGVAGLVSIRFEQPLWLLASAGALVLASVVTLVLPRGAEGERASKVLQVRLISGLALVLAVPAGAVAAVLVSYE
jgi:hypothetical protein